MLSDIEAVFSLSSAGAGTQISVSGVADDRRVADHLEALLRAECAGWLRKTFLDALWAMQRCAFVTPAMLSGDNFPFQSAR